MGDSAQFPSGEWVGFYLYPGHARRFMMDLILEFRGGVMSGEGSDGIGPFVIDGTYSESSLECSWVKTYVGKHSVFYTGYREGKGIWGNWNILQIRGGFQIWPIGSQPPFDVEEEEAVDQQPVEVVQPLRTGS
jgi:hypothetical protein